MRHEEFQEKIDGMVLRIEESGHLVKRKEEPEDSTGDMKETTTDSKATKDIIDIGVIFTQGRNKR